MPDSPISAAFDGVPGFLVLAVQRRRNSWVELGERVPCLIVTKSCGCRGQSECYELPLPEGATHLLICETEGDTLIDQLPLPANGGSGPIFAHSVFDADLDPDSQEGHR